MTDEVYTGYKPAGETSLAIDIRNGELLRQELKADFFKPFRVKGAKHELKGEYILTPLGMAEYRAEDNYASFADSVCRDCISGDKTIFGRSDIQVKPAMSSEWCEERVTDLAALGVSVPMWELGEKLDVEIDNRTWFPDYDDKDDNFGKKLLAYSLIGLFFIVISFSVIIYQYR